MLLPVAGAVNRERGFALVYGASIAGWTYLVAWGALHAAHASHSRSIGAAIGATIGCLVVADLIRLHQAAKDGLTHEATQQPSPVSTPH